MKNKINRVFFKQADIGSNNFMKSSKSEGVFYTIRVNFRKLNTRVPSNRIIF